LPATGRDQAPTPAAGWRGGLAASAVVVVVSILWQRHLGVGTDPSWGLTLSERLLDGERLYVDILHTNPPLNAWLNVPAVAFARWTGLSPELALYLRGYLVVALGVGLAIHALTRSSLPERVQAPVLLPVSLYLLLIGVGMEFGQREHLGLALFLPFVVVSAQRLNGERPGTGIMVASGLGGAFLVLLKPHYLVVVAALVLPTALRTRRIRALFPPEAVLVAVTLVAYLAWTRLAFPEFYTEVLPLMEETYLRYTKRAESLWVVIGLLVTWGLCLYLTRTGRPRQPLGSSFAIAAVTACIPFLAQGKNWPYHGLPAIGFAVLALVSHALPEPRTEATGRRSRLPGPARATVVVLFVAAFLLPFRTPNGADPDLVAVLTDPAVVGTGTPELMAIGFGPNTGFPLTRQVGATFPSRWAHDWHGSLALYFSIQAEQRGDRDEADRYRAIAEDYRSDRIDEIARHTPEIVVLDLEYPFWTDFVRSDPRFQDLLEDYRQVWSVDGEEAVFTRLPDR
jgi:hypothetical protein